MPSPTLGRSSLLAGCLLSLASSVQAAAPTAEDALKLAPGSTGIEYDIPAADAAKTCKSTPRKRARSPPGLSRSERRDPSPVLHSNGDNVVDTWSYYKNGLEVYRDADLNFNGKADQYRWFHTGGSRWGLDKNEDGKLDAWKQISPEEASEEVIAALRGEGRGPLQPLAADG